MTASHLPTLTVQVAFASTPLAATPTWVTLTTAKLNAATFTHGRQQELNAFQAGTASLTFFDYGRELDPLNASGPHYGQLLPNKRIRVLASIGAISNQCVFDGFVSQWPTNYAGSVLTECVVQVSDVFKLFSRATLPDCPYVPAVLADAPSAYWRLDETVGLIARDISGNGLDAGYHLDASFSTVGGIVFGTNSPAYQCPLFYGNQSYNFPSAATPSGTSWSIEFWYSVDIPDTLNGGELVYVYQENSGLGPGIFIGIPVGAGPVLNATFVAAFGWSLAFTWPEDTRPHHVVFSRNGSALQVILDGVDVTSSGTVTGSAAAVPAGDANGGYIRQQGANPTEGVVIVSDFATYAGSALSLAQAAAHFQAGTNPGYNDLTGTRVGFVLDLIGWPTAWTDIDPGVSHLAATRFGARASALTYLQSVETTEQAEFFFDHVNETLRFADRATLLSGTASTVSQATFTDDPSLLDSGGTVLRYEGVPASLDDQLIYNEVSISWDGGSVLLDDVTSQTAYGLQANPVTSTLLPTQTAAVGLATWLLAKYKNPQTRILGMSVDPVSLVQLWPHVLRRAIGDRVTVRIRPNNTGSAASFPVIIEGVSHSVDTKAGTWDTTFYLRPADQTVATWDHSLWDGADVRTW